MLLLRLTEYIKKYLEDIYVSHDRLDKPTKRWSLKMLEDEENLNS